MLEVNVVVAVMRTMTSVAAHFFCADQFVGSSAGLRLIEGARVSACCCSTMCLVDALFSALLVMIASEVCAICGMVTES